MHRGAIAPNWIITAWIGIPSSGTFPLPSHPQACRACPRPLRRARVWAQGPVRTYAAATRGAGLGTPASAHDRDPRTRQGRGPSGQHARMRPRPQARAWASQPARPTATPAPGTGAGPPASAQVRGRDPWSGPGQASQRVHPRPLSQAPARAGQHAQAPHSAPPEREGRRIMGHVTSPGEGLGTPHSALENGRA